MQNAKYTASRRGRCEIRHWVIYVHIHYKNLTMKKQRLISFTSFFSSPEPKAHGELIVYRSIRRPSVRSSVRASVRKHFQTQISPQPVGQS